MFISLRFLFNDDSLERQFMCLGRPWACELEKYTTVDLDKILTKPGPFITNGTTY